MRNTTSPDAQSIEAEVSVNKPSVARAGLFIFPAVVVTLVSVLLFEHLKGLPAEGFNAFSVTILVAIVTSLVSVTAMQILVYRIVEDHNYFKESPGARSVWIGLAYCLLSTLAISTIMYFFLMRVAGVTTQDFFYFAVLHFLFSAIWVLTSAFWATGRYLYPSLVFSISYVFVYIFTYVTYRLAPSEIIVGYALGIGLLFVILLFGAARVFPWPKSGLKLFRDLVNLPKIDNLTRWAIAFSILYTLSIFLDKILVWIYQGAQTGSGLLVTGTYTTGAFLGLVPLFSVGTAAFFTSRTQQLVDDRYKGTLSALERRSARYQQIYWKIFGITLLVAVGLLLVVVAGSMLFNQSSDTISVIVILGIGCIFLSGIVFNSSVLPILGLTAYSVLAVSVVVIAELAAYPFFSHDVRFAAVGFAAGSFTGFVISCMVTRRGLSHFSSNIFRLLSLDTLKMLNQKRGHL